MSRQDPELERLFSQISALEAEYNSARNETDFYRDKMNQEWSSLHDLQTQYRELKEQANEEFRSASYCWEMGDRASAKDHSENGKILNEKKAYIASFLDDARGRYDPMKKAYEQAKERQTEILNRLKEARAAKNRRLDELKEAKEREAAHWHEKNCQRCGVVIRYRDDWSHVPNYCKKCKAEFDAEKQRRERLRREKPCKGCGAVIVYYEDWDHIPNYCKECREKGNTWSSRTSKQMPKKSSTYGILDYSGGIRKQNSKDLSEGKYGAHKWYDPYTGQMGEAGPDYTGKKRGPRYD